MGKSAWLMDVEAAIRKAEAAHAQQAEAEAAVACAEQELQQAHRTPLSHGAWYDQAHQINTFHDHTVGEATTRLAAARRTRARAMKSAHEADVARSRALKELAQRWAERDLDLLTAVIESLLEEREARARATVERSGAVDRAQALLAALEERRPDMVSMSARGVVMEGFVMDLFALLHLVKAPPAESSARATVLDSLALALRAPAEDMRGGSAATVGSGAPARGSRRPVDRPAETIPVAAER